MTQAVPRTVDEVDAVLPQTQCGQCGFDGCRPYAQAIVDGRADINRCPPGGEAGMIRLATVVARPPLPLDPTCGMTKPLALAVIDEAICIGCTLCIQACPVDAIVGGATRMHDVVAELCTGCELCLPPCPVDCIRMVDAGFAWDDAHANAARTRHHLRNARLVRIASDTGVPSKEAVAAERAAARKRAILDAAIDRARAAGHRRLDALKAASREDR